MQEPKQPRIASDKSMLWPKQLFLWISWTLGTQIPIRHRELLKRTQCTVTLDPPAPNYVMNVYEC